MGLEFGEKIIRAPPYPNTHVIVVHTIVDRGRLCYRTAPAFSISIFSLSWTNPTKQIAITKLKRGHDRGKNISVDLLQSFLGHE